MRKWFTSDYHINHANMIKYCNRPFENVKKMNETIIARHNERVKDNDIVFDLGDFIFCNSPNGREGLPEKPEIYLNQLNGRRISIEGNHDRNNSLKTGIKNIVIRIGSMNISLCHNPDYIDRRCDFAIVGHVHDLWKFKKVHSIDCCNVGVDVWNFRPVSWNEIMHGYYMWKKQLEK